jgi:hypothetical protein
MKSSYLLGVAVLVAGVSASSAGHLSAQTVENRLPSTTAGVMLRNLRPSGQPVIPLFDGWFRRPDGTVDLCFGYHNLNLDQKLDIPLGPDNFIEPSRFDGVQPTHFDEVPEVYRRRFCVFTVNLTDVAAAPTVVWTLRIADRSYSVPGSSSELYRMDEIRQSSRGNSAPLVRFEEPGGQHPERRGRTSIMVGPTVTARVGDPLTLSISVSDPERIPLGRTRILWAKHRGPGNVMFSQEEAEVVEPGVRFTLTTAATFSEAGDYVIRLQAVDWDRGNSFGFHCCWTNSYLNVSVTLP